MITNKDIRVENGFLIINGDKYPLDGQSPETIMEIVEDNSDTTPTENSTAPVTSGGVYTALGTKQDTLTFDSAPTDASTNPVTSGGLYNTIGDITQTGVTGASVAAQLAEINSNLVGNVEFTLTFNSDITDINVHGQKCFYNPATKRVDIYFDIYSASNLIPGQTGTIATIPVAYRPAANVQTTALCLTTDNKLEAEGCFIAAVGSVGLNNFISGKANYKFVSARTSYYLN